MRSSVDVYVHAREAGFDVSAEHLVDDKGKVDCWTLKVLETVPGTNVTHTLVTMFMNKAELVSLLEKCERELRSVTFPGD